MSKRRLIDLIDQASNNGADNVKFVNDVKQAIIRFDKDNTRKGSNNYKPSSLTCMRNMYFTRTSADQDLSVPDVEMIGMANTGTARHENIQNVLLKMKDYGFDWEYIDVSDYLDQKHSEGKCLSVEAIDKCGAETHLIDNNLHLSFRCDGIIKKISTGEYYLFEFKNVISFKFNKVNQVLDQHHKQVICYCLELDLDKAFVVYENRDTTEIKCPEIFNVTDDQKEELASWLITCEEYVNRLELPPRTDITNYCKYCNYKMLCDKVGDT